MSGIEDLFPVPATPQPGRSTPTPAYAASTTVMSLVDKYLVAREPEADHADDSVWHCSQVSRALCPRYEVIQRVTPSTYRPAGRPAAKLQRTWDIGTWVHRGWQNEYLGQMGILFGKWTCGACWEYSVLGVPPATCPECGAVVPSWVYEELTLQLPLAGRAVRGHCDGIIILPETDLSPMRGVLLELKTINPFNFSSLSEPAPGYVDQVSLYLYALAHHRDAVLPSSWCALPINLPAPLPSSLAGAIQLLASVSAAHVLYIDKSSGGTKEFVVQDVQTNAEYLISQLTAANEVLCRTDRGEIDVELPAKHVDCAATESAKCKSCFYRQCCLQCSTVAQALSFYGSASTDVPGSPWGDEV